MDRFNGRWKRDRRQAPAVRLAAVVCLAMSFAVIALKVAPLG
ncbi:MAG: hypothetical protein R3C39_10925 [Dehalococcoidia bacterium]